ncbi:hypothetical protein BG004_008060 [Podila humilis]|nr:hypothetical protein BG004_008060 [Podila humilis]
MDLLNIQNHLQEGARRAAGTFLTPLTNAIGEQKRLIESLAVVSKVRVEECKHMMLWSKSQAKVAEDSEEALMAEMMKQMEGMAEGGDFQNVLEGMMEQLMSKDILYEPMFDLQQKDVLLKLNLLIRKISDYEIRFGAQYGDFREKIKHLRTKDDTLCEMGQRQNELQMRVIEASKSKLRSAKAKIWQSELDDFQKKDEDVTKLQQLKRELIKAAYAEQLNAIVEFGKKLQIIGEHGLQLLEHIDVPGATPNDGRETEDILQSARINLENWDKLVMVNPQSVVIHPVDHREPDASPITVTLAPPDNKPAPVISGKVNSVTVAAVAAPAIKHSKKNAPPLPPRETSHDGSDLVDNRKSKKNTKEPSGSEEDRLRLLEELEIKQALELSRLSASKQQTDANIATSTIDDLKLTPEELRFVMESAEQPKSSSKTTGVVEGAMEEKGHSRSSSSTLAAEHLSIVTPKVTTGPRIVRNPQVTETAETKKVSQQGPRPWIPAEEQGKQQESQNASAQDTLVSKKKILVSKPAAEEELASNNSIAIETMGETTTHKSGAKKSNRTSLATTKPVPESMGSEVERPLESMGSEPEQAFESMGSEGHEEALPAFVSMPRVPSLDGIRAQKILQNQQQQLQDSDAVAPSPELQYLELLATPQFSNAPLALGQISPSPTTGYLRTSNTYQSVATYQPTSTYQPATKYVPGQAGKQQHQRNNNNNNNSRISGSPQLQQQQQYQLQHQQYQQQQYQQYQQEHHQQQQQQPNHQKNNSQGTPFSHSSYSSSSSAAQFNQQQQQQLHDFYYTPSEQQQQQQQQSSSTTHSGWNVPTSDSYSQYGGTSSTSSPSPSHISLITEKGDNDAAYKVEL